MIRASFSAWRWRSPSRWLRASRLRSASACAARADWRASSASLRSFWTISRSGCWPWPSFEVAGGSGDEVFGEVQAAGDLEGVGLADVADVEAVARGGGFRGRTRRRRSRPGGW